MHTKVNQSTDKLWDGDFKTNMDMRIMMKEVFHSGNPVMKHIRVGAVFLWRLSLLIAILWGCFYLGYKSAFLYYKSMT
tara:strand:- start:26 stop:259 length:234 start_codon:yes stop_codon:yes gene_type:complete